MFLYSWENLLCVGAFLQHFCLGSQCDSDIPILSHVDSGMRTNCQVVKCACSCSWSDTGCGLHRMGKANISMLESIPVGDLLTMKSEYP